MLPKAELRYLMPSMSTMTPVVTVGRALITKPKSPQMTMIVVKDPPIGISTGNIAPIRVAIIVTTRGLTEGMSVTQPEITLPTVLVIPTMEIRKEAFSGENPKLVAIYRKRE